MISCLLVYYIAVEPSRINAKCSYICTSIPSASLNIDWYARLVNSESVGNGMLCGKFLKFAHIVNLGGYNAQCDRRKRINGSCTKVGQGMCCTCSHKRMKCFKAVVLTFLAVECQVECFACREQDSVEINIKSAVFVPFVVLNSVRVWKLQYLRITAIGKVNAIFLRSK